MQYKSLISIIILKQERSLPMLLPFQPLNIGYKESKLEQDWSSNFFQGLVRENRFGHGT
jgi:hypothetical protein